MRACLAFLLATALLAAANPREQLAAALEAHQEGRLADAAAGYEALLRDYPQIVEVRSNLGAVYAGLGRYDDAIREYETALSSKPDLAGARLNLALAYHKSARFSKAAAEFRTVRLRQPDNEQALKLLADSELNLGNYGKVIALLEPLRAAVEADRLLTYALGTAYVRAGREDDGQQLIDRLFREGESPEALMLLANAQMQGHDYAGARDNLAKAVELAPDLPTVHRAYAMALIATGDQAGARVEFENELDANPNDFEANLNMAAIHKKERDMESAERLLGKALQARPGNLAARYQLGTVYMATRRIEEARAEFEAVVGESPDFIEAHVSLATVYYRLRRKEDGDREREIVRQLNAAKQATQPGTQAAQAVAEEGAP